MWRRWLEHDSSQLKKLEVLLLLGFYAPKELNVAKRNFNADPYFRKLDFKLEIVNAYQALICGNFKR